MSHTTFRRFLATGAIALSGALMLTSCAGGFDKGSSSSGASQAKLVAAIPTDPTSMDPIRSGSLVVLSVFFHTFDQLVAITPEGELAPKLATEWKSNADLTQWDFTLHKDVKASNGEPITAADVAFSYQSILNDPTSENFGYLSSVKSVEAVDDLTVRFTLNSPFSAFPRNTSLISVVPEDTYKKMGPDAFAQKPVGSGPYVFEKIQTGVTYDLARNDTYWGDKPKIEHISLQPVASDESRVNGVLSGSLDVAPIGPTQVASVKGQGGAKVSSALSNGVVFLGVNSTSGVLKDVRVREAIALAIDKKAITTGLLSDLAEPAKAMLAPAVEGYSDKIKDPEFNKNRAKELLKEAGYAGEAIPFDYATDGRIPLSSDVAQTIQASLQDVGIKVDLRGADQQAHTLKVRGREMQGIYLNTWAPSTVDGDLPLTDFYEKAGNNNYAQDPKTAAWATEQRGVTGQKRLDVFADLLSYSNEQGYFVPLYVPMNNYAAKSTLDWTPRADGLFDFTKASFH